MIHPRHYAPTSDEVVESASGPASASDDKGQEQIGVARRLKSLDVLALVHQDLGGKQKHFQLVAVKRTARLSPGIGNGGTQGRKALRGCQVFQSGDPISKTLTNAGEERSR